MPEFLIQNLLVAICLVLPVIFLLISRKANFGNCIIVTLAFGLLLIAFFAISILEPIKWYQCHYTAPEQIWITGHIQVSPNRVPNNYLVLLFRDNQEVGRFVTRYGSFAIDGKDEPRDGYFELAVPNVHKLTRCSMLENFKQDDSGSDLLWLDNEVTYLWRSFAGLEAGTTQVLNRGKPEQVYTLVVLPDTMDGFPSEISLYPTYLDRNGKVAINLPIKTYRMEGTAQVEESTGYFIYDNPLSNLVAGMSVPAAVEAGDAWVADGSTYETTASSRLEPDIIDRDNCLGALPPKDFAPIHLVYFKEVQFQQNDSLNFDLGAAALKAAPSLGFTQGQMETIDAMVSVDAPAGTHKKYKVFWQDVWRTGSMSVDFGLSNIKVPVRARTAMTWTVETIHVDCP